MGIKKEWTDIHNVDRVSCHDLPLDKFISDYEV